MHACSIHTDQRERQIWSYRQLCLPDVGSGIEARPLQEHHIYLTIEQSL